MSIYDELGVRRIINAAGTFTEYGGSLMSDEVISAWQEAARQFVDLRELQQRVGERLAQMLGVEAALVTGGAASSILLGTAAAITIRDPDYASCFSSSDTVSPYEVLRPIGHCDPYDRQVMACGVRIVDVHSLEDARRKITARTVMMMSYNFRLSDGMIAHQEWLDFARRHSLPTLLDAAADIPPTKNLWAFNKMGYDLVAVSGGKAIAGPQDTGLLLGRADLIEAAQLNAVPNEGTIGRACKVSKEDIVALWKAVEQYVSTDADAIWRKCEERIAWIENSWQETPQLKTSRVVPPSANRFPHLLVSWDVEALQLSYEQMAERLRVGEPSIVTARVAGTGNDGFLISVINLQDDELSIVARRVQQALG